MPRSLQAICDKATSKDPTERYATASEFRADLVTWQEFGKPIALKSETPFEYIERFSQKHPRGVIAFALLSPLFLAMALYAQFARSAAEQAQIDLAEENAEKTEAIERLERANYLNTINFRQTRFRANGEVFNSERIGSGEVSVGTERFKSFEWHFFERKLAGGTPNPSEIFTQTALRQLSQSKGSSFLPAAACGDCIYGQ